MPPAQTSRSDCAASAVSVSRLTDRRRQRGPSAGAAAHAARHLSSKIRTPGASLGVSIEARQILARFSDQAFLHIYFCTLCCTLGTLYIVSTRPQSTEESTDFPSAKPAFT